MLYTCFDFKIFQGEGQYFSLLQINRDINFLTFVTSLLFISLFKLDNIEPVIGNLTCWIDVCQNDGNLLVSGGARQNINIFDKRESQIIKTFDGVHSSKNFELV